MKPTLSPWAPVGALCLLAARVAAADSDLQEVVVTALRDTSVSELPASVTVLGAEALQSGGVQHLADVLAEVPGLGAAGGTSRPRSTRVRRTPRSAS